MRRASKLTKEDAAWRAANLAAAQRVVDFVNQHPTLWPRLFDLTMDEHVDWRHVLKQLVPAARRKLVAA